jgi:sigma-B regulation protein RsbU (phosphoserine phosphatase)
MPSPDPAPDILIVDDNPANLRLLTEILRERGFHSRAVTSGVRALASVELTLPDLILLDIRMPGMDGYEVCQRLKANPATREAPVIFISALDEITDKVKAFELGGVDYITKPFQLEEVAARVETHLTLRSLQKHLQEANRRMGRELLLAAQVQASFLPKKELNLPGWGVSVALLPALQISGDFFDTIRLPDGKVGLLIADVVDKGVGAALFMAMSCTLLRTCLMEHPQNPELVFTAVNQHLLRFTSAEQFVTVFLGILDPGTGQLTYANAGHHPPLLFRATPIGEHCLLAQHGLPLGILEEADWQQHSLTIAPGEALVLHTDGIPDAENQAQEFYGMPRLVEAARKVSHQPAHMIRDEILASVRQFMAGADLADDLALMVVKREENQAV